MEKISYRAGKPEAFTIKIMYCNKEMYSSLFGTETEAEIVLISAGFKHVIGNKYKKSNEEIAEIITINNAKV